MPRDLRYRTESSIIARFSSRVVRKASRTCRSQDFPNTAAARVPGVAPRAGPRPLEELHVLGIAARPSPLDVVDPKLVELLRDPQLIVGGEGDPRPLGPVPQRRVVEGDPPVCAHHVAPVAFLLRPAGR